MTRRLLPLLTAVLLLLSQQLAFTHVYSHFGAAQSGTSLQTQARVSAGTTEPSVVERLCALCVAAADLAAAMPGTLARLDVQRQPLAQLLRAGADLLERSTRVVFLSRAPPSH